MAGGNLQRVANQAWETFSTFRSGLLDKSHMTQRLSLLRDTISKLCASDLNIDTHNLPKYRPRAAPAGYMDICEDNILTMGVFTLRKTGLKIPLHNHPDMHGILKVLYGQVRIITYSQASINNQNQSAVPKFEGLSSQPSFDLLMPTQLTSDAVHSSESGAILLSPDINNIHSIEAVEGPAAFIDVLSPPYDPPERDCQYYHELRVADDSVKTDPMMWLLKISQQREFHCEMENYPGPDIHLGTQF